MRTVLTIDGRTLIDDDLEQWQQRPNSELQELIKPGQKPQPWLQSALIALADAAMNQYPIEIHIVTSAKGWAIKVDAPLP